MATTNSDVLSMIQTSARNGTLLPSCAPEVKELMSQIDSLISSRRREWESSERALQTQLQGRDKDIATLKVQIRERNAQVEHLRQQSTALQREYRARNADYESQLDKLQSEVSRLTKAYSHLRTKKSSKPKDSQTNVQLFNLTQEVSRLSEELTCCQEENRTLRGQAREVTGLRTENKEIRENLALLQETIRSKDELVRTLEEDLSFAQSSVHVSSCEADLCQAQDKLKSQVTLEKALREELKRLKENRDSWTCDLYTHRVQSTSIGESLVDQFVSHVDDFEKGDFVTLRPSEEQFESALEKILARHFTQLDHSLQNIFPTQTLSSLSHQ